MKQDYNRNEWNHEDLKEEFTAPNNDEWAADSQDELEDWIEEQGIQLRY